MARRRSLSAIALTTLLALVGALLVVAPVAPAGASLSTETLLIDGSGAVVQQGRIFRDGVPSTCESGPKAYPGVLSEGTSYGFATLTFEAPHAGCLVITRTIADCLGDSPEVETQSTNAHLSVYDDSYDPADQAAGFLGDQGASTNNDMSIEVEAGGTYVVVATNVSSLADCSVGLALALPPDTTILTGADNGLSPAEVTFSFEGSADAVSFECNLDDQPAWSPCTSPVTYTGLAAGPHGFQVRSVDEVDSADPTPAMREWVADLVAPDTQITAPAPGTHLTRPAVTVEFTSLDADVDGFLCKLDDGDTVACTSPTSYAGLADGAHTLEVTAFDQATNSDQSPATVEVTTCDLAPKTQAVNKAKKALKKAKKKLRKASGTKAKKKARKAVKKAKKKLAKAKRAKKACATG